MKGKVISSSKVMAREPDALVALPVISLLISVLIVVVSLLIKSG
jgi:hypothetical protein